MATNQSPQCCRPIRGITIVRWMISLILISNMLAACTSAPTRQPAPASPVIPSSSPTFTTEPLPTSTPTHTSVPTATQAPIPTITPTASRVLPVLEGTPLPESDTMISPNNVKQIREMARWTEKSPGEFGAIGISPDGRMLASNGLVKKKGRTVLYSSPFIRVWEIQTGKLIQTLEIENEDGVDQVVFSPDGQFLGAHSPNVIQIWRVKDWDSVVTFSTRGIRDIAFSPDGKTMAYALDWSVRLLDIETGKMIDQLDGKRGQNTGGDVDYSPDGKVIAGSYACNVLKWESTDGHILGALPGMQWLLYLVKYAPDGKTIVTANGEAPWNFSGGEDCSITGDKSLSLFRAENGELLWSQNMEPGIATFSSDSQLLATTDYSTTNICLRSLSDGRIIQTLTDHGGKILGLAFTPDGKYLVSSSEDGTIRFWGIPGTENIVIDQMGWEFNTDGDLEGWESWNQLTHLIVRGGYLLTNSTGEDPYMGSPIFSLDAAKFSKIEIRMKVSSGNTAKVFFIIELFPDYNEAKSLRFAVNGDGAFHIYTLDMSILRNWKGIIQQIRLDPVENAADIEIDYIRLLSP